MPAGLPYVGWGARPSKNGQPPACIGQCNLNIGARKVGGATKRLPSLEYGPKAKEQILQRWDPATKSMVNINPHAEFSIIINSFYITPNSENSGQLNTTFDITNSSPCAVSTTLLREIINSSNVVIYSDTANSTDAFSVTLPLTNGMAYRSRISIKTELSKVATSNPYTFAFPTVSISSISFTNAVGRFVFSFNFNNSSNFESTPFTYILYSATDASGTGITQLLGASLASNGSGTRIGSATAIYGNNYYLIKVFNGSRVIATSSYFVRLPFVFVTSLVIGNEDYATSGEYSAELFMKYRTPQVVDSINYTLYGTNDISLEGVVVIGSGALNNDTNNEQTLTVAFTISSPTGYLYYFANISISNPANEYVTNLVSPTIKVTSLNIVSNMPNDNSLLYTVGYTSTTTAPVDFTLYGFQSGDGEVYEDANNTVVATQTIDSHSGTFSGSFPYDSLLNSYYCKFVVNELTYYSNRSQSFTTPPAQSLFISSGSNVLISPFSPLSFRFNEGAMADSSYITSISTYNRNNVFQMEYTAYPFIIDQNSNLYIRLQDSANTSITGICRGDGRFTIDDSDDRSPYISPVGTITSRKRIRVTTVPNTSVSFGTTDSDGNNYVNLYTYTFGGAAITLLNFTIRFGTPDFTLGSGWTGSYLNIIAGTVV